MSEIYDRLHEVGRLLDGEGYGTEADVVYEAAEAVKKLESDNAKLREYVAWLENDMLESYFVTKDAEMLIWSKRRDFGIEVDG